MQFNYWLNIYNSLLIIDSIRIFKFTSTQKYRDSNLLHRLVYVINCIN